MVNPQPIQFTTTKHQTTANIPCPKCGNPTVTVHPAVFLQKYRNHTGTEPAYTTCPKCKITQNLTTDQALQLAKYICFKQNPTYSQGVVVAATALLWKTGRYFEIKAEETKP